MTSNPDGFEPTNDAEKLTELYVRAFNSGDAAAVNRLYTDDAVSVWEPGKPLTGQPRREGVSEFLAQKPSMKATVRQSYVTGDAALMVVDWSIDTTSPNGEQVHYEGVGLDVLRRDEDKNWRYVIDCPFGEINQ